MSCYQDTFPDHCYVKASTLLKTKKKMFCWLLLLLFHLRRWSDGLLMFTLEQFDCVWHLCLLCVFGHHSRSSGGRLLTQPAEWCLSDTAHSFGSIQARPNTMPMMLRQHLSLYCITKLQRQWINDYQWCVRCLTVLWSVWHMALDLSLFVVAGMRRSSGCHPSGTMHACATFVSLKAFDHFENSQCSAIDNA